MLTTTKKPSLKGRAVEGQADANVASSSSEVCGCKCPQVINWCSTYHPSTQHALQMLPCLVPAPVEAVSNPVTQPCLKTLVFPSPVHKQAVVAAVCFECQHCLHAAAWRETVSVCCECQHRTRTTSGSYQKIDNSSNSTHTICLARTQLPSKLLLAGRWHFRA
jgi:hypothetical protein